MPSVLIKTSFSFSWKKDYFCNRNVQIIRLTNLISKPNKTARVVIPLLLLLLSSQIYCRPIWISLYHNTQIQSVVVSAYNGPVTISEKDKTILSLETGKAVYISRSGDKLWMSDTDGFIGFYSRLSVSGADSSIVVRVKPAMPQIESRNYEETVLIYSDIDRLRLINQIDEERYLSGVVEAEVGAGKTGEFYKAKAVICRTYLYGHINRHASEGFHLCDETHCQAYKGQCRHSDLIRTSVFNTRGIILTDRKESKPILAAYHSNCGGETESAKNAWQTDMPYLVPVSDPYCKSQPNARWQTVVSLDEWINCMIKNGFKPDPKTVTDFNFQQLRRIPDYKVNKISIPTKQIRMDMKLRSSFFSVTIDKEKVILDGKGYGHGVGLCQEGAMEMGRRGRKYDEIISFYYKQVNLVPVSSLQIEVPEFKPE